MNTSFSNEFGFSPAQFRSQVPVCAKWAYFDHAAVSPLSDPARRAILDWLTTASNDGDTHWTAWYQSLGQLRQRVARLIDADPREVALVPSTTAGINLVAEGFPWQPGDNVVTLANEFPSNLYPWLNLRDRGVETRLVPVDNGQVDPSRVSAACDSRTRIVSVSWVGYASGWRIDVAELSRIAHDRGALFMLDAIQGLGVFPISVRETAVDFLAADGHKWLLGPEGAGIFFVRLEHLDLLRPIGVGWHSAASPFDYSRANFAIRPDAARYEGGSQNMAGFLGLNASVELLMSLGLTSQDSPLAEHVIELTDIACERLEGAGTRILSPRVADHKSGIVTFEIPGLDPQQFRQHCLRSGVALSCRGGGIRISPHGYGDESDVDRLLESVRGILVGQRHFGIEY